MRLSKRSHKRKIKSLLEHVNLDPRMTHKNNYSLRFQIASTEKTTHPSEDPKSLVELYVVLTTTEDWLALVLLVVYESLSLWTTEETKTVSPYHPTKGYCILSVSKIFIEFELNITN